MSYAEASYDNEAFDRDKVDIVKYVATNVSLFVKTSNAEHQSGTLMEVQSGFSCQF